jgi:hypothetical protein
VVATSFVVALIYLAVGLVGESLSLLSLTQQQNGFDTGLIVITLILMAATGIFSLLNAYTKTPPRYQYYGAAPPW